ncbi:MAG: DUF4298 domain-containing protein [Alysiella sp.]|uniref:DUF4298 domain-containing protein n=1 Tax=Alysiella sp. TaxID=1872483 RepID=UPI0026DB9598|nr:DUF4298 domain-containing protein [Alysiella sp.]MDO4433942.1 DUF4298 domain-containing protein [Alysiella sp.]
MKKDTHQQELDRVQTLYREWTKLLPELEADIYRWQKAIDLIQQIEDFYTNGHYRTLYEAQEKGIQLNTHTEGEYSILSEDAIWNALHDFRQLTLQRLKSAVSALEHEYNS